jgi:hypothetical protein
MNMKKISAIIAVLVFAVAVTGYAKDEAAKPAAATAVVSKATTTAAPASAMTTTAVAPVKH